MWAYSWLAITDYALGNWDEAILDAERAVALLGESGHAWLRPLVRWAATVVPAARGDWRSAEEHARLAVAQTGDYELMTMGAALARGHLAAARGDNDAVLRVLEPLTAIQPREAVDEPGFWPWRDLYGDALINAGLLDEAHTFLVPREALAEGRGRRVEIAKLARVRGRLESARGNAKNAEAAFQHGLEQLGQLPLPFERALLELAHGQTLRRNGKRRAAAVVLQAAADRFATLEAQPYLERSERELTACGLSAPERRTFDPTRLTAQELAVARLVADGLSNRAVAAELFVSIKTVQFHLTHIYAKLGLSSRAELAARLRDDGTDVNSHPHHG
jgi:DNA-binding CsgD family transcriptional regulator